MTTTTQTKITQAARQLFVKHGYSGTSIAKIASLAGVNRSLIFHHFTNKQGLWTAVKHSFLADDAEYRFELPKTSLAFADYLSQFIHRRIAFCQQNPDILRMFAWQRLEDNKGELVGGHGSQYAQACLRDLHCYQKKGEIAAGLKAEYILTYLLSIVSSFAADPNHFLDAEQDKKAYVEFCIAQLVKGVTC